MKSSVYNTARFITALITILLFAAQSYIPKKSLVLHPKSDTKVSFHNNRNLETDSILATWIDESRFFWRCKLPTQSTEHSRSCGVFLNWNGGFPSNETTTPQGLRETSPRNLGLQQRKNTDFTAPCLLKKSDIDNDGYGLEYGVICKVRTNDSTIPLCTDEVERHLSDGWAWQNNDFCRTPKLINTSRHSHETVPKSNAADTSKKPSSPSIDFSRYDTLKLKVFYEGRASDLRIYLRNKNPKLSVPDSINSAKFMSTLVRSEDLTTGAFEVNLSDFRVAEWWLLTYSIPREQSGQEFENVIGVGIEHDTPGTHKTRIDSIEITGEWFPREDLLILVALFWFLYLIAESLIRYLSLRERTKKTSVEIDHLTQNTQKLEQETNELQELSITDSLTGIFNRTGVSQLAKEFFKHGPLEQKLGLMILDIDHFKLVNDSFGHDIGDNILKRVTNLVSSSIRKNDIFGRWGGEEFVILCPRTGTSHMMSLAEKLRSIIEKNDFEPGLGLDITISIGATSIKKGDSFNDAFKRADMALYTAKNLRNRVSFQA